MPVTAVLIYVASFPGRLVPYLVASSAVIGAVEGQLLTLAWMAPKAAGTTPPNMTWLVMVVFMVLVALAMVWVFIHGGKTLGEGQGLLP